MTDDRSDRVAGMLLGTALGNALGLPAGRLLSVAVHHPNNAIDRFRPLPRNPFLVSVIRAHAARRLPPW